MCHWLLSSLSHFCPTNEVILLTPLENPKELLLGNKGPQTKLMENNFHYVYFPNNFPQIYTPYTFHIMKCKKTEIVKNFQRHI